ncbi:hypothetical protein BH09CHL1_BH09CHL1_25020 [soil metagenome]
MEDILGGRTDPTRFERFLADWRSILKQRADEAIATFSAVPGLRGLILGGSVGRNEQWPLSDIDFITIFDDERIETGKAAVEKLCEEFHSRWFAEGWRTGLDIGKLSFGVREVATALNPEHRSMAELLHDDRWYHSLDKGFQSRAVFDTGVRTAELAQWFTTQRFSSEFVQIRLDWERNEVESAIQRSAECAALDDALGATIAKRRAGQWLQIWFLETHGERDASLARVGTRFEHLARTHDQPAVIDLVNTLNDLEDSSVDIRLAAAPAWVREWHDRAWRARQLVADNVTRRQHARDMLRVCSMYELRYVNSAPFASWLAVVSDREMIARQVTRLDQLFLTGRETRDDRKSTG